MGYYNDVLVESHYGGRFKQDSITKKTVYVEGDKCCEVMDKDKTSFIDLLDLSASLAKATKDCITMHYKIPDVDVGESLGSISSDNESFKKQAQAIEKGPEYLDPHLFDYESGSDYQPLQSSSESECYEDSPQNDDESDPLDGNYGIIQVAFAVVEAETKDSWFTFLEQLRDFINSDHVTFMSDRQKGLTESVQAVFPEAHHRFCVRHMYKNFQKEHKGLLLRNIFWRAARAYTIYEFNMEMEKLKEHSPQARAWCDAVPPYQWSRAYFNEDVKCKEIANNFSKSWNNFIAGARAQPICDLVDVIRRKLMVKFHDRRKESNAWENVIVKKVDDEMKEIELKSRGCALLFAGSDEYEVNADDGRHAVFLHRHSCTCRQWQVSGIPCKHAVACILNRRERPEAYCAPCYKTTTLQATYVHVLHPIPHKEQWNKPAVYDVHPPSNRRSPRCPRRNRRRDVDEEPSTGRQPTRKQKVTCALCKQLGHNRRTCKNTVVSGSKRSRPNDTI
ncbi:hypothetical protein MRB53_026247 [Persea americana]|uniref:Uncharacterized protein n=1 Tax=Persea americana TaxID=3435 RepID=A0ACC2LHK7_PERAE|nr:hypothetical protein MRB53_026247 [Persea americana]